jgi:hypothetical protein
LLCSLSLRMFNKHAEGWGRKMAGLRTHYPKTCYLSKLKNSRRGRSLWLLPALFSWSR